MMAEAEGIGLGRLCNALGGGDEDFGGAAGRGLFANDDLNVAVECSEEIHEAFDRKTIEAVVG